MLARTCRLALGALLALLTAAPALGGKAPTTRLPDLAPVASAMEDHFISVEEGRRLLRFPTLIENVGDGPLEVLGRRNSLKKPMRAYQSLYNRRNRVASKVPIGEFIYHLEHSHWHLLSVARYRLLHLDGTEAAAGTKISFCLMDSIRRNPALPGSPTAQQYFPCPPSQAVRHLHSGISVGWADLYASNLFGQWVDVTDVPPGEYLLECEIDPDQLLREKTRDNNTATIAVTIP